MLQLYKNIKNLRKERKWTQEELATRMGYDRSMITKIESGKVDLSQSKILEFAKIFGVDPGDLMGWDDDTPEGQLRNAYKEQIENKDRQEKANALYDQYESLPPEKQAQFDNFLKFLQSDTGLPRLH